MARANYLKISYQMKYGKFLDLINFGRKRTVFIETLVYALNIIFYGY